MKYTFTYLLIGFLSFVSAYGQCPAGQVEVKIVLTTDNYSTETSWQLKDKFGSVLATNGTLANATTFTNVVCVPANTCMDFTINDAYGDGICCNYGSGNFQLYVNNVLQLNHNGQFASLYNYYFDCAPGESCSTAFAVTTGTYTAPGSEYYYKFKPTQLGIYDFTMCGLTNSCNTKIWIYENCNGPFTTNNTGTIMYNDDYCALLSKVSGALDTTKTYIVRVGSLNNACNTPITFAINYAGPISGCTVSTACNYNPLASVDDGSCMYYPNPLCTGPDLTIVQSRFASSLSLGTVNAPAGDCRVAESCLSGYGTRTVINFDTYIKNVGDLDYYIGSPTSHPSQFSFNNCHGHAHYEGYAEYRLYKFDGTMYPVGFKNGFCVLDFDGCPDGGIAKYSCSNMGITKQCGDIYSSGLDCQWIDITDIDTGSYTMAAKVNWDQSADALGHFEKTYSNNWAQACIHISENSSGVKSFSVLTSCPSYSDCAGVQFGNSTIDCHGVCGGTTKMGDLNVSGTQQTADGQIYVNQILNSAITPNSCNDLNNSGSITVWDAALITNCALNGTHLNTKCLFPQGNINPNETATLSISGINVSQNFFDIDITNPNSRILGYEFNISGASILNVVNRVPISSYPENPEFLLNGNKIICLSYKDSTIPKSSTPQSLCRVYYTNPTGNICITSITDIVNKQYEAIMKVRDTLCIQMNIGVGIAQVSNTDHYFSVVPNPATDMIQLTGYTKNGDDAVVEIRDVAGRLLYKEKMVLNESFTYPINISDYKSGIYYVTLSSKSGVATKPIVVAK